MADVTQEQQVSDRPTNDVRADILAALAEADTAGETPAGEVAAEATGEPVGEAVVATAGQTPPPVAGNEPPTPVVEPGERVRDPVTGRFVTKGEKAPGMPEQTAKPAAPTATGRVPAEGEPLAPGDPSAGPAPPPASWRPLARDQWDKIPREAQQEVIRREREMTAMLQKLATARQTHEQFQETIRPFEGLMAAAGHSPMESIRGLLQTAAALRTLPAWDKAALVMNLIRGHDVDIDMLLAQLGNPAMQPPPSARRQAAPQDFRDPRVDAILERQATTEQRQLDRHYEEFSKSHPYFEHVRDDMADFIELAEARGVDLTDEDAYNRAVALHPDLIDAERRRAAANAATNPQGSTARAIAASKSVKPTPVGPGPKPASQEGETPRDAVRAAFEEYERRA